jgi:hypothetical protein
LDQERKIIIKTSTYNPNHAIAVGEKKWNFERPVISPDNGFTTIFKQDNFEVTIVSTKNLYIVSADHRSDIDAFIRYTNGLQISYVETIWKVQEVNLPYIL